MKKSIGFYIFIGLACALVGVCIWAWTSIEPQGPQNDPQADTPETALLPQNQENEAVASKQATHADVEIIDTTQDEALLDESLREGFLPTQETGELGSRNGALHTKAPMNYKPTQYERLKDSPLLIFTDDMIWQDDSGVFYAKKDAMADQAFHYQESAIALSVAPKYEKGQLTGYRLVEIPDNTLFAKLGLVSGDAILSINGTKPDMEPMALTFVNMVAGKYGKTTIEVEHRGKKRKIEIRAAE